MISKLKDLGLDVQGFLTEANQRNLVSILIYNFVLFFRLKLSGCLSALVLKVLTQMIIVAHLVEFNALILTKINCLLMVKHLLLAIIYLDWNWTQYLHLVLRFENLFIIINLMASK